MKVGLNEKDFKLGGVLILFNNLLQSLFKSQILTLGLVMIGIFLMFLILFRNIKISLIGVIPNFIAAFAILGLIGLLNIPLDMMTITIAAITIGIAVDNSIHYIYRFIEEYKMKAIIMRLLKMPLYSWYSNIKYINYNSLWFFNTCFIKFYTNYLFWNFYRYSNVVCNVISFNFVTKSNFINKTFWH